MAKGYWIARIDVRDPEQYKKYVEGTAEPFRKYGAKFLARGGRSEGLEGKARARNVVIEFESFERAVECFRSPEYQAARAHRLPASDGEIVIVEGVA
ncbi:MAG: DUF1330 domain-containing protein [Alphaproteobacteria bacterium]|nr:DUF1330 domain-containing protein [Alphaproteobacteria bacterium]MBV9420313.1 DUF1330 domain-containing protein [Alphaproteobacteria bacterium]MBV9541119.1 DUF1330 domain-containing protein [Alphaproteobacteria bacterium]MBV9903834.1 DUF1330 domain-containing protein [Alphaproteobacteria bacterium]